MLGPIGHKEFIYVRLGYDTRKSFIFLSHLVFKLVISSLLLVLRYTTRTAIRGACTWHSDVKSSIWSLASAHKLFLLPIETNNNFDIFNFVQYEIIFNLYIVVSILSLKSHNSNPSQTRHASVLLAY
jgi:hypothetical protein